MTRSSKRFSNWPNRWWKCWPFIFSRSTICRFLEHVSKVNIVSTMFPHPIDIGLCGIFDNFQKSSKTRFVLSDILIGFQNRQYDVSFAFSNVLKNCKKHKTRFKSRFQRIWSFLKKAHRRRFFRFLRYFDTHDTEKSISEYC